MLNYYERFMYQIKIFLWDLINKLFNKFNYAQEPKEKTYLCFE